MSVYSASLLSPTSATYTSTSSSGDGTSFAKVTNMASGEDYSPRSYSYATDAPISELHPVTRSELTSWGITDASDVDAFFESTTAGTVNERLEQMSRKHLQRFVEDPELKETCKQINLRRLETSKLMPDANLTERKSRVRAGSNAATWRNAAPPKPQVDDASLMRAWDIVEELKTKYVVDYFSHLDRYVRGTDAFVWLALQFTDLDGLHQQILARRNEFTSRAIELVERTADAAYLELLAEDERQSPEWRRKNSVNGFTAPPPTAYSPVATKFMGRNFMPAPPASPTMSMGRRASRTST